jgi:hypothetical protein
VRAPAGRATVSRGNSAACAARHGRARRVERCDVPGVLLVQDVTHMHGFAREDNGTHARGTAASTRVFPKARCLLVALRGLRPVHEAARSAQLLYSSPSPPCCRQIMSCC